IFGIFPFLADDGILNHAFTSIAVRETELYLKLWHGFNTVLVLSIFTIIFGLFLFVFNRYLRTPLQNVLKLEPVSPQSLTESDLIFGIFPFLADDGILNHAFTSIAVRETELYLKLWHGFNTVLVLSIFTIIFGLFLFVFNRYLRTPLQNVLKLEPVSPQSLTE